MKQLPGLDASFLHLETPQMPMHVGALHDFELPADYAGDFVEDMRAHMAGRLARAPALRQKLARMPLNFANPSWVDAEPDLDEHIVRIALPEGSGAADLEAKVGELHSVLLERDRPLWKFHVFDGLAPGPNGERRYAMYTQLHHAAVDGQAAVALGQAILDLTPVPPNAAARGGDATRAEPRRPLGMADMLRAALANQLDLVVGAVKAIPSKVGTLSQMAASAMPKKGAKRVGNLGLAPRTRLNVTVSAQRAFASISLPLARLNGVRRKHHASLNDALLMICSGALRRYFLRHGPLPRKSLVAGVPISTRAKGDTSSNNQATMTVVSLGTHIADPKKRLAHVLAATAAMKNNMGHMKSLMPGDFPSLGVPWLMEGLGALYAKAKVADRLPVIANVTISNVPGPTVALYMAGAKMLTNYPTSIVVHGVALNITVQTYNESLEFGLMACGEAMPDVAELAQCVQEAFDEFQALPPTDAPASAEPPEPGSHRPAREPARKPASKASGKAAAPAKRAKTALVTKATPAKKARASAPKKVR